MSKTTPLEDAAAEVFPPADDDIFKKDNVIKTGWMTFGKVGDYIVGTLVHISQRDNTLTGKKQTIYEIKVQKGIYHELDGKKQPLEPGVVLREGDYLQVGSKDSIDKAMRAIKVGQVVGMKFEEEHESQQKGNANFKQIGVYPGKMDESFMGEDIESVNV